MIKVNLFSAYYITGKSLVILTVLVTFLGAMTAHLTESGDSPPW